MKSPISYYGGKHLMLETILPMIPEHIQYGEPFCGGASIYWAKTKSTGEFINDIDFRVTNFWSVLQNNFDELYALINSTLHSEQAYLESFMILKGDGVDKIKFAWAFWVQCQMTFSHKIFGGFAFDGMGKSPHAFYNKRDQFNAAFTRRMNNTAIFNRNAIDLIRLKDSDGTFMYFDPPYAEADGGHYDKLKGIYYDLLDILPSLKCKWLLSSYPSPELDAVRTANGYQHKDFTKALLVNSKQNEGMKKTECLTYNYPLQFMNKLI